MGVIGDVISGLPPLTTLSGLILYSLLAYIFTFTFSWLRVKLLNDNVQFGSSMKDSIIKKRKEKSKAAQ